MIRQVLTALVLILPVTGCAPFSAGTGAGEVVAPDLAGLARRGELRAGNRQVVELSDGERRGARVTAAPGELPIWLDGIPFTTGTIEVDVRGKDLPQQSFLGIAFGGADESTYEVVYLRPFNFRAADPGRSRAVQYVSLPTYTWQKLRSERPEEFENPVLPVPDPNDWVRLRVVVEESRVQAFVGDGSEPDLVVDRLGARAGRRVGLWVGNNSAADFANPRISR